MRESSGTRVKEDHREKAKVVQTCYEKGRKAHAKNSVSCTRTKDTESKTENQVVERLL